MPVMPLSAGQLHPVGLEIRCLVNHLWSSFLGKQKFLMLGSLALIKNEDVGWRKGSVAKGPGSVSRRLGSVSTAGGTQLPAIPAPRDQHPLPVCGHCIHKTFFIHSHTT